MKRRWLIIGGMVLAALALIAFLILRARGEAVPAIQLNRQDVIATLTVTGEVEAETSVAFSPPVTAQISDITVEEGDLIRPGQLLARLETGQVSAQLAEARARAAQAAAELAEIQRGTRPEQIELAQQRYEEASRRIQQIRASLEAARERAAEARRDVRRMADLFRQEFISRQEYEAAQTRLSVAQREVERLEAELAATQTQRAQAAAQLAEVRTGATAEERQRLQAARQAAEAAAEQARERVGDYRVISNISGIVTERVQDPGDLATPGQPILRAVKPESLEVLALVEEPDLPKIHTGDTAYVILDALPQTPLTGVIRRIGSRVDPETGTVEVRINLTESALAKLSGVRLMPGMTADVNIVTQRLQDVLVLPATAVRSEGGQTVVYRFADSRLVRTPVRAERISIENYRILAGLQAGDWVAAVASEALQEKGTVRPVPQETLPQAPEPAGGDITGGS